MGGAREYAPAPSKQVIYNRATGERLERWPVDAAELLATGDYTTDPSQPAVADAVTVEPVAENPVASDEAPAPVEAPVTTSIKKGRK